MEYLIDSLGSWKVGVSETFKIKYMPKVRIMFSQKVKYDQQVEMSQEDFDALKDLDDDISEVSPERHIIDKYVDYTEVLDAGDLEDVCVELAKPKKKY